jgi:hypothetical protein
MPRLVALVCCTLPGVAPLAAQQVADSSFHPDVGPPAFARDAGPRVVLDQAHHNFHTVDGRYLSFARLLRADGFVVSGSDGPLTARTLADVDVLVIANALNERNALQENWALPTPSAFTAEEIPAVRTWVQEGGALLLIADHMPFAGAAHDLAGAFDFDFVNGFAFEDADAGGGGPMIFRRADGSLAAHPVTDGGLAGDRVDSVATFTGSAFRAPPGATSLLTFRPDVVSLNPDTAWTVLEDSPRTDVGGWSQGAVAEVGRGRVAVFGEAAMFSAQLAGPQGVPMGMNAPLAAQNPRFLLNLMEWLSHKGRSAR